MKMVTIKLGERLLGNFPANFREVEMVDPNVVLLKKLTVGAVDCIGPYPLALHVGDVVTISITDTEAVN